MRNAAYDFSNEVISHRESLRYFALSLTHDEHDSEDLVQETLLKALSNKGKFEEHTNLKAWLYTIMKNIFINNYRKQVKVKVILDSSKDLYFLNIPENKKAYDPENTLQFKELRELMLALDEEYKIPLTMYFEGFKYKEIADHLKLPIGTVKSRIFLARKQLYESLAERA